MVFGGIAYLLTSYQMIALLEMLGVRERFEFLDPGMFFLRTLSHGQEARLGV